MLGAVHNFRHYHERTNRTLFFDPFPSPESVRSNLLEVKLLYILYYTIIVLNAIGDVPFFDTLNSSLVP
jgi:hypothetical protein